MITCHIESFKEGLPELQQVLPLHYEELALNKEHVPLAPQYDIYFAREDRGELLYVTMRSEGRLIGYFIGFIAPGLHYKTCLTCIMDIFYVVEEFRGLGGGQQLFKFVEQELRRRKVQRWFVGSKLHKDISGMFEKLNFEPAEVTYTKWLGE